DVEELGAPQRRAGRVELELDAAEGGDGLPDQIVNLLARGDIDPQAERFASLAADLLGHLSRTIPVEVRAHHIGPFAREDEGRGLANSAGSAGDDDGLADEVIRSLRHGWFPELPWLKHALIDHEPIMRQRSAIE